MFVNLKIFKSPVHQILNNFIRTGSCITPEMTLKKTSLYDFHLQKKGRMVPFAGYEMPVQYDAGVMKESISCREVSGLFDVSHMRQVRLKGKDREDFLNRLVVADVKGIPEKSIQYSLITTPKGGIYDDTLITRYKDHIYLVLNAGCAEKDLLHLRTQVHLYRDMGKDIFLEEMLDHSLIAIQGPKSQEIVGSLISGNKKKIEDQYFLQAEVSNEQQKMFLGDYPIYQLSRSGYTGEDGFEISVEDKYATKLMNLLLETKTKEGKQSELCGLGARDALRLEAGLPLYGNELTEDINPLKATLLWTVSKNKREINSGFLGDQVIGHLIKNKKLVKEKRIGFEILKGSPARDGAFIYIPGTEIKIGQVSSGAYSPTLKKSIGMAYVLKKYAKVETEIEIKVRNRSVKAKVVKLPHVPNQYYFSKE